MIKHIDLERLVSAGAVDRRFRELLLTDPLRASEGYLSEPFRLTPEEKAVLAEIHTEDYQAFVVQVADWISRHRSVKPWEPLRPMPVPN